MQRDPIIATFAVALAMLVAAACGACGGARTPVPAAPLNEPIVAREGAAIRRYRPILDAVQLVEPHDLLAIGKATTAVDSATGNVVVGIERQADIVTLGRRAQVLVGLTGASSARPLLRDEETRLILPAGKVVLVEAEHRPDELAQEFHADCAETQVVGTWRLDFTDGFAAVAALRSIAARGMAAYPELIRPRVKREAGHTER